MHARRGPTIAYNAPQRRHASSCFTLLPCVRILRYATCMDDAKRRKVLDSTGAIVPLPAPSQQQVVEYIKGISVLELSQLVKSLETELGVSAAMP